jgi:hypothetical protein
MAVGGKVCGSSPYQNDGIEKAGERQCEEESEVDVHGRTP